MEAAAAALLKPKHHGIVHKTLIATDAVRAEGGCEPEKRRFRRPLKLPARLWHTLPSKTNPNPNLYDNSKTENHAQNRSGEKCRLE